MLYDALAFTVDFLHICLVVLWFGGWFVSKKRFPTFRRIHSFFGIVIAPTQALFSFRCPMVLLSGYLRQIAHPEHELSYFYKPFVVTALHNYLGFSVSDICVTITLVVGMVIAVWTLLTIKTKEAL
jgi:hypothetical protein